MIKLLFVFLSVFLLVNNAEAGSFRFIPSVQQIDRGLYLTVEDFTNNSFVLRINSINLPENLSGIGFKLNFDSAKLKYQDYKLHGDYKDEIILNTVNVGSMTFALSSKNNALLQVDNVFMDVIFKIIDNGNLSISLNDLFVSTIDGDIINNSVLKSIGGEIFSDIKLPISGNREKKITPVAIFIYGNGVILIVFILLFLVRSFKRKHLLQS
jgi:hypothetical protein